MRYSLLFTIAILFFTACKKDKYTTAPQIVFKSFNPDQASNYTTFNNQPVMILEITDAEGDLGNKSPTEVSKVFVKNLLTSKLDSIVFPDLSRISTSNFKAEIEVGLRSVLGGRNLPSNQRPYQDNLQFEVYVIDFAKNKSNVIITDKPFTYFTLP
jgi:hypothetical protein